MRLWRGPEAGRCEWRSLDSLVLLFDRLSGQTHMLAPPMPEILETLGAGPLALPEIAAQLAARFDVSAEGDVADVLHERLRELAALGLVTSV